MNIIVKISTFYIAVRSPDFEQEGFSCEDLFRCVQEAFKQVPFTFGKGAVSGRTGQTHFPAGPGHIMVGQDIGMGVQYKGASGDAADPCQQFFEVKGLHKIIIGTQVKSGNLVLQSTQRRDQNDGDIDRLPAQCGKDFRSFMTGQHTVQQDYVVDVLPAVEKGFFAVEAGIYVVALAGKLPGEGFI